MKLKIEGMSCGGCVKSVSRIILKNTDLDDTQIAVSLEENSVALAADLDEPTLEKLAGALKIAGFEMSR